MDWLNTFSDEITVLAVVMTTLATIVLAVFNIRYVRLVRKMLIAAHRPEIIMGYHWGGSSIRESIIWLYVKNVGRGTAYDIEFEYDESYELPVSKLGFTSSTLGEIKILQDGISILEQDGETSGIVSLADTVNFRILKQFWEQEKNTTKITVSYKDSEGFSYKKDFTLDLNPYDFYEKKITHVKVVNIKDAIP